MNQLFVPIAIGALVIVAILAIVFNPSIMGVGFALIVIIGACTVWLLRRMYLAERDEDDR
jgi:Flp pilus assembly protein TadB